MNETTTSAVFEADNGSAAAIYAEDLYTANASVQRLESLEHIGAEERTFFYEQGYLVIDKLFNNEEVEAARVGINALIDGVDPSFRHVQLEPGVSKEYAATLSAKERRLLVRKLMNFTEYDTGLNALANDVGLLGLLERLMEDKPLLFQEMALLKGPGGREKPWHQDCAYFDFPLGTMVIGVWIALDEVTVENACLYIMPGTHREGPVNHFSVRDWQICDSDVVKERAVAVPLAAGGCLLWHGMVHHGSPCNRSKRSRRALQFHYKPAHCSMVSKEERLANFGGEGRGAQC